jgi:signal transduction histidine kinase
MAQAPILDRFRRRLGVRMRSALAAAAVVAVVSILAGGALLVTARSILISNVTAAANDRASQVAVLLSAGETSSLDAALRPSARDRTVVQVLDAAGRIVAASDAIAGVPPISGLRPEPRQRAREERRLPIARDEPFQIVAVGLNTVTGRQTVLVAESLDSVDDATDAILLALLIGLPLLAAVVAVATFWFVGRSLRPVEAMRRQAATITSTNLHERLPVPQTDDEIAALAATMNTMLERIEAASAAQRQLVADASHELRSPLATIHANADLLDAAPLPDASARSVARIHAESVRMGKLVDDLLLLARVDDHKLRLRRQDVDLDDLVYAERERIAIEHPDLSIEGRIEPIRVAGDPEQLHRAVRNLVDNAVRHARRVVTLSVVAAGGEGQVLVGNDGPPIAGGDRSKIFDRFVRLDDSRSRQDGGAGLGLPIARDIVHMHGGTITVDDRAEGAAFRIRLPVQAAAEHSPILRMPTVRSPDTRM